MAAAKYSPKALRDLNEIWDYTEEHWGLEQAETYTTRIRNGIERVAAGELRGKKREDVGEGIMSLKIGSHYVFYRKVRDFVHVGRILHERMDPSRHIE